MRDPAALSDLAARQGGPFTVSQARSSGWTKADIEYEVRRGSWMRPYHGVCIDRETWRALDARGRHLFKASARLLVLDDSWHAARRTAAVLHQLPLLGQVPGAPQLARPRRPATGRASSRHERVTPLPLQDRTVVDGFRVTSLARTVVDLARDESMRSAVVVADAALRRGLSGAELLGVLQRCGGWVGASRAARVLAFADGRAESPFESVSRLSIASCELPAPELQAEIWFEGAFIARVDFLWREAGLVGEADGRSKYTDLDDLYAEKRREERLRDLGFVVVRWDWATAWRPADGLDQLVRRGLARASCLTVDPGVRIVSTQTPTPQDLAWAG